MEQIIFEGDVVRHVRQDIISEGRLADFLPQISRVEPLTFPVLPQNPVRYVTYDKEKERAFFLVETAPRLATLSVRHRASSTEFPDDAARSDDDNIARFRVQLPYQYFAYAATIGLGGAFTVTRSYLYWAPTPIRSAADRVWPAETMNVGRDASICWGSTQSDSTSLSARLDDLVNNFWITVFNEDLGHATPFGGSLSLWEQNSGAPLSYMDWPMWNERGIPVSDLEGIITSAEPVNLAALDPSYVDLPELPDNFTIARAHQLLNDMPEDTRLRLIAAVNQLPVTEEAPA